MVIKPIEWNDQYNIGVDYVDKAHKQIFSIMSKIGQLLVENDYDKNKHACKESIKFLYNYTDKHFREEEAYMQSIQYSGYEQHKKLHDNLRNNTIPILEAELEKEDFSPEAIRRFVGVFAGWLTGHIMVEDGAISGRVNSRYKKDDVLEKRECLKEEVVHTAKDIFRVNINVFNEHYAGEELYRAIVCEMKYAAYDHLEKNEYTVYFVAEEQFVCYIAQIMTGIQFDCLQREALIAFYQLVQSLGKAYLQVFQPERKVELIKANMIAEDELKKRLEHSIPECSIAWKSDQGYFAICIDEH